MSTDHDDHAACRVLVVDDDRTIRTLLETVLSEDGFAVTQAENGADALEQLSDGRHSVILLDIDMPVMDGRTFYRRLAEQGSDIPTVIVSAHGARAAALELGAAAAVEKPFDIDALSAEVARLCRASRPRDEHRCRELAGVSASQPCTVS